MKRQNIRTLSLVIITLTYLIIGAAVFDYMESENERIELLNLNVTITDFKLKHNMNESEFLNLWHLIIQKKPYNAGNQWKFIGSLYFCTVVITLIGYGHSTPRTVSGKCFCILYSFIGIPIALIMFQSVGERLNSFIVYLLGKIKYKLKLKNQEVGLFDLITVEAILTLTITFIASYIFVRAEGWTYFDSIYYCFITLTTIGFGDMVPMQSNNMLNTSITYACFTIFFILTGLTTLASSINLLVLRLATINAEEQVQEKLEAAEAKRQAVHLDGDVISGPNGRLLVTQEKPEECDTISVCSCTCLDHRILTKKKDDNMTNKKQKSNKKYSIKRNPTKVKRLAQYKFGEVDLYDSDIDDKIMNNDDDNNNSNKRAKRYCFNVCNNNDNNNLDSKLSLHNGSDIKNMDENLSFTPNHYTNVKRNSV